MQARVTWKLKWLRMGILVTFWYVLKRLTWCSSVNTTLESGASKVAYSWNCRKGRSPGKILRGELAKAADFWATAIKTIELMHLNHEFASLAAEVAQLHRHLTSDEFDKCQSLATHLSKSRTRGEMRKGQFNTSWVFEMRFWGGVVAVGISNCIKFRYWYKKSKFW